MAFYNVGTIAPGKKFGETFMESLDPYLKALTQQMLLDQYDPARRDARERDAAIKELMSSSEIPTGSAIQGNDMPPPRMPFESDIEGQNLISSRMTDPTGAYENLMASAPPQVGELAKSMANGPNVFTQNAGRPETRSPSYGEAQGIYKQQQMSPIELAMSQLLLGKTGAETGLIGAQSANVASETQNRQQLTAPTIQKLLSDVEVNLKGQLPNYQAVTNKANVEAGLLPGQIASENQLRESQANLADVTAKLKPQELAIERMKVEAQVASIGEARAARESQVQLTKATNDFKAIQGVAEAGQLAVGKTWDGLGKIAAMPQNAMPRSIAPYVQTAISESAGAANTTIAYSMAQMNNPLVASQAKGSLQQGLYGLQQTYTNTLTYMQDAISKGDPNVAVQYWQTFQQNNSEVARLMPEKMRQWQAQAEGVLNKARVKDPSSSTGYRWAEQ